MAEKAEERREVKKKTEKGEMRRSRLEV